MYIYVYECGKIDLVSGFILKRNIMEFDDGKRRNDDIGGESPHCSQEMPMAYRMRYRQLEQS